MKGVMCTLFVFFTLSFTPNLGAQTEKGTLLVGGAFDLFGDPNAAAMTIHPTLGTFVADGFAIGTSLNIGLTFQERLKQFSYGLSPFLRYYLGKKSKLKPFFHAQIGYNGEIRLYKISEFCGNSTGPCNDTKRKYVYHFLTAQVGAGLAYFVHPNIAIEGGIGYGFAKLLGKDIYYDNVVSNIGFRAGIQVHLGRKKEE